MKIKKKLIIFLVIICQIMLFACAKKTEVKETTEKQTLEKMTTASVKETESAKKENININKATEDKISGYLTVKFGKYENEDIDWLVLDKNDESVLLLAKEVLDCQNYNEVDEKVTYENSSIRKWLNSAFVDSVFNNYVDKFGDMSKFGLIKGDKASLLNIDMCKKYFGLENAEKQNKRIISKVTSYAKEQGMEYDEHKNTDFYECGSFWLSDNSSSLDKAVWVGQYGHIYKEGQSVKLENGDGVRPLICLKNEVFTNGVHDSINANIFHSDNNKNVELDVENDTIDDTNEDQNTNHVYSNVSKYKYQSSLVPCSSKDVVDLKSWKYGKTPVEWIYVDPDTQILSNISPNKSSKFGYKTKASSGPKGCFMVAFTDCDEVVASDFDGRLYSFEDYTKIPIDELKFNNKFADLKYGEYNVLELLKKRYELTDVTKGVYMDTIGDVYINVVYVDELDDIISNGK